MRLTTTHRERNEGFRRSTTLSERSGREALDSASPPRHRSIAAKQEHLGWGGGVIGTIDDRRAQLLLGQAARLRGSARAMRTSFRRGKV
jgi:hypothetical protein